MRIPTVKVKDATDGFYVINESDFDEEKHELFESVKELKKGSTAWYKQQLDEMNVEYSDSDKKADLKALYDSNAKD